MTRTARYIAVATLAAVAALAAIIAADFTPPTAAQSEDETTGRIVARQLADGRVEFGWQPTGGARVLPRQRYFPADITHNRWLRSSPVEVDGAEIGRINARQLSDGRIEFAFTPTDGERITPQARYFPAGARANRWLRSTEITIGPSEDAAPRFTAVSAGLSHTCAIRESGEIACWGFNQFGQSDAPEGSFTAVSAGGEHTCAIRDTGEIVCWGYSEDKRTDAPEGSFTAVSAGPIHTCAIRESDSGITCWGANRASIPGTTGGVPGGDYETGQIDAPEGSFTAVSAGFHHTCGLRDTGEIACWGWNEDRTPYEEHLYVTGRTDAPDGRFTAVSAGRYNTCGLRESGAIECWGDWGNVDDAGQADIPGGSFTAISVDLRHTCAIRAGSDTIYCWGSNRYIDPLRYPEVVYVETGQTDAPEGSFTAVSAGFFHTCGLRKSGTIECWGSNYDGQTDIPTD